MSKAFAFDASPAVADTAVGHPSKSARRYGDLVTFHGRKIDVLGVGITPANLNEVVSTIDSWRSLRLRGYVCCVSVHGIVTAQHDASIRDALNGAAIATKDGMPMAWWCRRSGDAGSKRLCGSDLFDAICRYGVSRGYRHYFYGGSPQVVEKLAENVKQLYPGIIVAGYKSPPFRQLTEDEDAADAAEINEAAADFVWVGLGMPKQEKWIARQFDKVDAAALLGVGAVFDFFAGTKPRAPVWMQRTGLEWLFRLASEPRRLARRYLIDNSIFISLSIRHLLGFGHANRSHS